LKTEPDFHAATRPRLLAVTTALFEALYDPGAATVLATLKPADMRPGGARVPGTSYEVEPATAARAMQALLALRSVQAGALVESLAQADQAARYAVLAGQPPPTLASLYQHCTREITAPGAGSLEAALKGLLAAAEKVFTPTQARRIALLCQLVRAEPARLDAIQVQQFVAGFVRNSP
jgi:hypothetical protein